MNWIPIAISLASLAISLFVASNSYYRSKPRIKIMQMNDASGSFYIKSYDGVHAPVKVITLSPKMERIALVDVVITNQSSLPISIIEFRIENSMPFNSDSHTIKNFTFTYKNNSKVYLGSSDKPLKYIKPLCTLSPYTSEEGYLSFWLDSDNSFPEETKLTIITSRKDFNKTIYIKNHYESQNKYEEPVSIRYE
ncbi:hypothetical protein ACTHQ4_02255 [Alkalicoccobacillus gibsonii]|uniref:hypothetical protein n=1 Tax=Alkalicoccobacillus gibsonii TaxID=79881 RepID=UPI003F7C0392